MLRFANDPICDFNVEKDLGVRKGLVCLHGLSMMAFEVNTSCMNSFSVSVLESLAKEVLLLGSIDVNYALALLCNTGLTAIGK